MKPGASHPIDELQEIISRLNEREITRLLCFARGLDKLGNEKTSNK